ncbi:MAG: hypothetical protein DRP78_03675 [Candidatus Omnitrophota bacterium]|nr:MAG: hypothetical protein DRP78_03675 [Candidatus Omnitrophota bacterium]
MAYPSLIILNSLDKYRKYFEEHYCNQEIYTFDKIRVLFPKGAFNHAFYESSSRRQKKKDIFSDKRAQRMPWIKVALADTSSELYCGWDNKRKCVVTNRRVAVVMRDYVVIIQTKAWIEHFL